MDSLLCTSDGWQSTLELKRPFPQCYTTTQVAQTLLVVLANLYSKNSVGSTLFLIDQSGSMLEDDFYTEIKFVKQLLQMENSNVGVIVFNSEAYIEIPLDSYSSSDALCSLYDHLDSLRFSGGSTNYEKAFAAALQQIQSYRTKYSNYTHQSTLIIMLTDGQNSETVEAAEILKSLGHIIMVVTDGVNKRRNLIKMVSNQMDNSPLLFSLNTFEDLEEMNKYINSEVLQNLTVFCCRLPIEFQKTQSRMFIIQKENLEVSCGPGYSLSVENSTLRCTEVGLNIVPTCFAVPKRIAEYVTAQISRLLNNLIEQDRTKSQRQILVFLVDQTDTMTPIKNNQALTFVKSVANAFLSSENRTVGLVNGQTHEAVMLIEPNVTSITEFTRPLNDITFNSTSYSLYKPLKYVLENLIETYAGNVLTVIISDRVYVSTPSLRLAQKILSSNSNLYVMEIHNETTESNIERLVESSQDFFVSGYYILKDSIYCIDSFETLEAVAENIYLI